MPRPRYSRRVFSAATSSVPRPRGGTAWADLPYEVLLCVASWLCVRDVYALGQTAHIQHRLAIDPYLWRTLFVRDFAHVYTGSLIERMRGYVPSALETWPPEARSLYESTNVAVSMPVACTPVTDLPLPFARAFAVGKNWTWLYRAHATTIDRPRHGCGTYRDGHTLRIGDWVDGSPAGYSVTVYLSAANDEDD